MDLNALNVLHHFFIILVMMLHLLMYLPLKPRRFLAVCGCLLILSPLPVFHLLSGSQTPVYTLPLYVPLFALYATLVYRVFTINAGFGAIIFTIATTMAHMQIIFLLIYVCMTQALGFPTDETTHLTARALYCVSTVLSLPLLRIYARPHFLRIIEAVERQKTWLIVLLSCSLFTMGNAIISILLSRSDPVALRNCLSTAFCIVVFYYTLYSFIIKENANQRLQNQVRAAERLADTYAFYDAELREKEQAVRALRHDFRHMLLHLEALLKDKDYEGVARHLESLSSRTAEMRPVAYCENMTVNTLAAYHFAKAREAGITCSATLHVPETLAIPPAELAVILGNALENAFKGAESVHVPAGSGQGYIRFDAKPVKDYLVFDLENNYLPGGYRKGAEMGLASIRELAEKHQGRAKAEDRDGVFRLNIVLRLSG
jgi:signal transduction histidine kinase